jgi:GNAT superfamily N-acetyltransferase
MVFDLKNLDKVRPLFRSPSIHLAVERILAGGTVSPIYVDNIHEPKSAVTWTSHRVYVAGDYADKNFIEGLNVVVNSQFLQAYLIGDRFVIYPDNAGWIPIIKQQFGDTKITEGMRRYYEADIGGELAVAVPDGFTITEVNKALMLRPLKNIERLMMAMMSEQETVEAFLDKSFGVAAVTDVDMAGWCLCENNTGDRFEVGVETVEARRCKGIATALTKTLAKMGREKGFHRIGWHCWASNEASNATARRLGFKLVAEYPAVQIDLA